MATFLVTVTGLDHPGITAQLTRLLARGGATLHDVDQVVLQRRLTLAFTVTVPEGSNLLKDMLFASKGLGVALDFEPVDSPERKDRSLPRYVVTIIGPQLGAPELNAVAEVLSEHHANIEKITRLAEGEMGSVELQLVLPPASQVDPLKRALLQLSLRSAFDVALQRESLFRRSKRLVVLDMDSTLIRIEVINELARAKGVVEQVTAITERAMAGEMDYDESLRQRLALLRGLDIAVLENIAAQLPLTEGAETLVRVLKRLGYRTAVISGGFSIAAEALKARLGIDHAYSNVLEVVDGKLTGKVLGPIVNAQRKADLLESLAHAEGVLLDQVIAVGDGANDLLMLQRAGLGIAFRGKPKLREAADTSLSASGLDAILFLLGLGAREVREASSS
jgi:phosphoserine phosphatase